MAPSVEEAELLYPLAYFALQVLLSYASFAASGEKTLTHC